MSDKDFELDGNFTINAEDWQRKLYSHCPQLTVRTQYEHRDGFGMCVNISNNNPPFYTPINAVDLKDAENILVNISTAKKKEFLLLERLADNVYNVNPNLHYKKLTSLLTYIFRDEVFNYLSYLVNDVRLHYLLSIEPLDVKVANGEVSASFSISFDEAFKSYVNDLVLSRILYRTNIFTSSKYAMPVKFNWFLHDDKVFIEATISWAYILPVNFPIGLTRNQLSCFNEMRMNSVSVAHVVAKGLKKEIGFNNSLIWSIKEDLKRFKTLTSDHVVVMGRKTFESIGKPLPNRVSIVITRNNEYKVDDPNVHVVSTIGAAIRLGKEKSLELDVTEMYIIGGAEIYEQTMSLVDKLYVTQINQTVSNADAFYPKIPDDFEIIEEDGLHETDDGIEYSYITYKRK